jgi:raffinose/stachyose/melibiose transport system permease protein
MIGRKRFSSIIAEVSFLLFALLYSVPLYVVLINAFKSQEEIGRNPLSFPSFQAGFDNLIHAFDRMQLLETYGVTSAIVIMSVAYSVFFSSLAAYALARIRHRFFGGTFWLYTAFILLPIQSAFIPLIFVLKAFHLYNNIFGLSMVYTAVTAPFAIFMFTGFIKGISREMEESAMVDGSSAFRTFIQIILPLLKPVTATVAIFQVIHIWDDLLLPLVVLNSSDYPTVTLMLYKFFSNEGMTDLGLLFGGFFLVLLPLVVLFLFFQQYFIKGLTAGSVKG